MLFYCHCNWNIFMYIMKLKCLYPRVEFFSRKSLTLKNISVQLSMFRTKMSIIHTQKCYVVDDLVREDLG